MLLVEFLRNAKEHERNHGDGNEEDQFLTKGNAAEADGDHHRSEEKATTEDAPIDGSAFGVIETNQKRAGQGNRGDREAEQEMVS
ncbi:MAG: hypothetical protein ACR2J1_03120 [Methyloceanibacter sp.]|uniref:hypothetical protein n=1 Tax=Methyloceanibacter sp. TaxID=1965321 RepID=UPI003D9B0F62